jgi:hypothetical protein
MLFSVENVVPNIKEELTTADLIHLHIESRSRHVYNVVSALFDVTLHIYTGKFLRYLSRGIKTEANVFLFFIFI